MLPYTYHRVHILCVALKHQVCRFEYFKNSRFVNKITGQQFKNAGDNSPSIWRREGKIITISIIFQVNCRNVRFFPREKIWFWLRDRINNTSDLEFVCTHRQKRENHEQWKQHCLAARPSDYLSISRDHDFFCQIARKQEIVFLFLQFLCVVCCSISRTSKRFKILLDSRFVQSCF